MYLWDLNQTPLVLTERFTNSMIHVVYIKLGGGGVFSCIFFLILQRLCSIFCGILYVFSTNRHEISILLNTLSRATVNSRVVWRWECLCFMTKRCGVYAWYSPHVTKRIGVYDTPMSLAPFCAGRLEFFKEILIVFCLPFLPLRVMLIRLVSCRVEL